MDMLKSAIWPSVSLQKLSESYSRRFESDLRKFTNMKISILNDEIGGTINVNNTSNCNANTTTTVINRSSCVDSVSFGDNCRLWDTNKNQDEKKKRSKRECEIQKAMKTMYSRGKILRDVYA